MKEQLQQLSWNERIKALRAAKGWSQYKAAEECCTVQKAFWSWEQGKVYPRKSSRKVIARALGVKEELIFKEDKQWMN